MKKSLILLIVTLVTGPVLVFMSISSKPKEGKPVPQEVISPYEKFPCIKEGVRDTCFYDEDGNLHRYGK